MRGIIDLINWLASNQTVVHAFQIVAGAVLVFGGLISCVGAIGVMIVAAWRIVFGGVRKGSYYSYALALIAGPGLALFWVGHTQATSELTQAIFFGWGYLPTILALIAIDDVEKTGRDLSRHYLTGYSGLSLLVGLSVVLKSARAHDGNLHILLFLIAAFAVLGLAIARLDTRHKQGTAQPTDKPASAPAAAAAPLPDREPQPPASPPAAPPRPAYQPAAASLAGDFDIPPQE